MFLVTGQFFGCRKIHYVCVLQEPNKISDYHYYLPTQELAMDLCITSFLSFVSVELMLLCVFLSHTVFSVFAFLSLLFFLPSVIYFAPAGWWSGRCEDGAPSLIPALLYAHGVRSLGPQGRSVGRLCSRSSTEKRSRERKPGN